MKYQTYKKINFTVGRMFRRRRGILSRRQLAVYLHIPMTTIKRLEDGYGVRYCYVEIISRYIGVDMSRVKSLKTRNNLNEWARAWNKRNPVRVDKESAYKLLTAVVSGDRIGGIKKED